MALVKQKIIPIFVPHQGCPHDCIFCNQKKITGISTDMTGDQADNIIQEAMTSIPKGTRTEIAFFGGSFTAIDECKQIELLEVAYSYKKRGLVDDIRLSTRPDCIDEHELDILEKYGVNIIELGVQSMDEEVLIKSIRGHGKKEVVESSALIKKRGFRLGLQMMIGLPGDSEYKCIDTAEKFVKIKPDFVRIYPTLVIKETGLEEYFKKGIYRPFSLEECIDITKKLMVIFENNNIDIIRVGLQATDDIKEGEDVVAGPYHPAFRELVRSRMIRDFLDSVLVDIDKGDTIKVCSANKNISTIVGNKRANRIYINEKYGAKFKTCVNEKLISEIEIFVNDVYKGTYTKDTIYDVLGDIYGISKLIKEI